MSEFAQERRRGRRPGTARGTKIGPGGKDTRPRTKGTGRKPQVASERLDKRRTQEQRSATSERGLLGAALELIAERGFRASSLQAIGERAGYSRGLVSHRFGSKEGLLRQLVTRMLDRWGTDVRGPAVGDRVGVEALAAVAGVHRKAIERTPDGVSARALHSPASSRWSTCPSSAARWVASIVSSAKATERSLRAGVKAGTIRADVDVPAQAALFLGVLRGITLQWLVDPNVLDLARVYRGLEAWLDHWLSQ